MITRKCIMDNNILYCTVHSIFVTHKTNLLPILLLSCGNQAATNTT